MFLELSKICKLIQQLKVIFSTFDHQHPRLCVKLLLFKPAHQVCSSISSICFSCSSWHPLYVKYLLFPAESKTNSASHRPRCNGRQTKGRLNLLSSQPKDKKGGKQSRNDPVQNSTPGSSLNLRNILRKLENVFNR